MPSSLKSLTDCPIPDLDLELDGYVEAYESAARIRSVDIADFLPPADHPKYNAILSELIRADLEFAWERGDCPKLEVYRDRFASLFTSPAVVHELATEEFRLRRASGEEPDPLEYRERFGLELFGSSNRHLARTAVVDSLANGTKSDGWMPQVGDVIPPGFILESELGAGAFGKVFLARQADLAGRPVAVKLSSKLIGESQILARLQHSNIVPIYSVHKVGQFQAIVMPFLGRTTLTEMIGAFRELGEPLSGKVFASTLVERNVKTVAAPVSASETPAVSAIPPAEGLSKTLIEQLSRFTFSEAVLWIGSELADGLAHAHDRGILHRDIKPANVLLTDDGRPMLLDFNLAAEVGASATEAGIGGTVRYMAPEQIAGLQNNIATFSAQSDIYSLGLILFELLAGRMPSDDSRGSLNEVLQRMYAERSRPFDTKRLPARVTPAIKAILTKCLAPALSDRYNSATELREDLLRQLGDRPLKFARNTSVRERVRKWSRRHPRLSSSATLGAVALVILAVVSSAFLVRQQHLEVLEAERARDDLRAAVGTVYSAEGPKGEAQDVRNAVVAALAPFRTEAKDWLEKPMLRRLSESDRRTVRQDAAVMMAQTAQLTERLAREERDPARRNELLNEAREWQERAGRTADRSDGESAFEALQGKRLQEKAAQLRKQAREGESRFAVWMTLGSLEARLDRHEAAIEAFSAAIGLSPRLPWPYFHRGVARLEAKRFSEAIHDFDYFLELRSEDADGYFNRGLARFELRQYRAAIADFDTAEKLGFESNRLYAVRAQAKQSVSDATGAERDRKTLSGIIPTDPRGWTVRGEWKLSSGDAKAAFADFDEALSLDPNFLPALRDRTSVLSENLSRAADAIATLDRILDLVPNSLEDRAARAVLLARLGRKTDAIRDAELCQTSESSLILYQVACVFLQSAEAPLAKTRALTLLRVVLRKDPNWAKAMPTDPDLLTLRNDTAFREIVAAGLLLSDK